MTRETLIWIGIYVGFGVLFSFCRTLADNRTDGARGWNLIWHIFVNCVAGLAGGLLVFPLGDIMNLNRSWRMLLAALIGWTGLSTTMTLLETWTKRRLPHGSPDAEKPGDSDSGRIDGPAPGL